MEAAVRTLRRLGLRRGAHLLSSRSVPRPQLRRGSGRTLLRRREHDAGDRPADGRAQRQARGGARSTKVAGGQRVRTWPPSPALIAVSAAVKDLRNIDPYFSVSHFSVPVLPTEKCRTEKYG